MSNPPPAGDGYSQPYGGYTDDPQGQQQQAYGEYDQSGAQPEQPQHDAAAHGKKKKRGYAAGAFEVGSGANAGVGGQLQGGATQPYGAPAAQTTPGYGGYTQPDAQTAQQGYQYPQQGYGQQPATPQAPAYGGYQAPDQGYPAPGGQPAPGAPGVAGITQGVGNMSMGGQPQPAQGGQAPRPAVLNQLYPTDLLNQPFNVSELDLPPPPIILPANVSQFVRAIESEPSY